MKREQKKPPELSSQAVKAIQKMDAKTKQRIRKGILEIPDGDISILQGTDSTLRLRIGGWRVLFRWMSDEQILVQKISPRGDAYKGV